MASTRPLCFINVGFELFGGIIIFFLVFILRSFLRRETSLRKISIEI